MLPLGMSSQYSFCSASCHSVPSPHSRRVSATTLGSVLTCSPPHDLPLEVFVHQVVPIGEKRRSPAGVEEDDRVLPAHLALAHVIEQAGHGHAGVDGVQEDAFG